MAKLHTTSVRRGTRGLWIWSCTCGFRPGRDYLIRDTAEQHAAQHLEKGPTAVPLAPPRAAEAHVAKQQRMWEAEKVRKRAHAYDDKTMGPPTGRCLSCGVDADEVGRLRDWVIILRHAAEEILRLKTMARTEDFYNRVEGSAWTMLRAALRETGGGRTTALRSLNLNNGDPFVGVKRDPQ